MLKSQHSQFLTKDAALFVLVFGIA